MAKKGGAGFKGTVHKIDGEKVHVKVGTTKYGDRIVAGQMKNVTKEELEIDEAKKAKPAFKDVKKAGEDMNEAEGSGTAIPSEKQSIDQKKRAQIAMKSADLKIKHDREREKLKKERAALRNEMFSEAMKKDKKKEASSKDKLKKGEALSGKAEPIEVSPEMNPTK
ncbi:hypothetical protein EB118_17465 [bacterium]|nr:hypothetical protein [bacterium]